MKENSSKVKITTNDLHLKNIFLNDYYLEVGNIDVDVMIKILKLCLNYLFILDGE